MDIRKFQSGDFESIKEITLETFDGVSIDQEIEKLCGLIHQKDWKWRLGRQVDDDLVTCQDGIFVMVDRGQVIGWISSVIDHNSSIGHVPHMAVRKDFQGKGIGRNLLMFVLKRFQDEGMSHVQIETLVQNQAANVLYQSIGFQNVAEKIYYVMDLENLE